MEHAINNRKGTRSGVRTAVTLGVLLAASSALSAPSDVISMATPDSVSRSELLKGCIAESRNLRTGATGRQALRVGQKDGKLTLEEVTCNLSELEPATIADNKEQGIVESSETPRPGYPTVAGSRYRAKNIEHPAAPLQAATANGNAPQAATTKELPSAPPASQAPETDAPRFTRSSAVQALAWLESSEAHLDNQRRLVPNSDAPVIAPIGDQQGALGINLTFAVSATDPDGPGPLVMSIASTTPALPAAASYTDNGDGTADFSWTPGIGDEGSYSVVFRAQDSGGQGAASTHTITIDIAGNQAPVIDGLSDRSVIARQALSFAVNSTDADGPAPIALTVAGSTPALPASAQLTDFGNGTASFDWTPADNDEGSYLVTIRATDGLGLYGEEQLTITVTDNAPPSLAPIADQTVLRGQTITFPVSSNDVDGPGSTVLSISAANPSLPQGATLSDNGNGTGTFNWPTNTSDVGAYDVTIRATDDDGTGEFSEQTVTLSVYSTGGDSVSLPFKDDFSDGNLNGWVAIDDTPNDSSWTVQNQSARQQNSVHSILSYTETYGINSFLALSNAANLDDYRFSATLEYLALAHDGLPTDIGVMFRYQDPLNYYRLSFNNFNGYARLEKQVNGVFTPLATNARSYQFGEVLNVEIIAQGSTIIAVINGDPVFAVSDASLATGSIAMYTSNVSTFDDVSLSAVGTGPMISLSSPLAYSATDATQINASAEAINVPPGGSVRFELDGTTLIGDASAPYSATFFGVTSGDHTVTATILDDAGNPVASDTNVAVATGGRKIVAIGDSITNGYGDWVANDNISASQRVISGFGYESRLIDYLDATSGGGDSVVFNEGIGGDRSSDAAFDRVDSVLLRHGDFDTALLMLGTNDATSGQVPSGLGCSGAACNGTFKGNMQTLIDKIRWSDYPNNTVASGVEIVVAEPPPGFVSSNPWTSPLNNRLRDYNTVITTELDGIQTGPNFFDFFMESDTSNYESLFVDALHPNALAYEIMAVMWHNALETAIPLPFLLQNMGTASAEEPKQDLMESGNRYNLDTNYTISNIPSALEGGRWIVARDADHIYATTSYLTFDVDRPVDVYVAFDSNATSLPNWLNSYSNTGLTMSTDNPAAPQYDLYVRSYNAGSVTVGGASANGASGIDANLIVIVVED